MDEAETPEGALENTRSSDRGSGVRGLMIAVLEDAVICYRAYEHGTPHRRVLARQAERWIRSDDSAWVFSFNSICSSLDLEPDDLRRGILGRPAEALYQRRSHRVQARGRRLGSGRQRAARLASTCGRSC